MKTTLRQTVPLRKRKIFKKSIGGVLRVLPIAALLTLGFLLGVSVLSEVEGAMGQFFLDNKHLLQVTWFTVIGLFVFSGAIYQTLYFLTYFYDIDAGNVVIRKGVVVKKEVSLPFTKITDVYVDQDFFDWFLGIYDVHISTPTVESGIFAHIDGVDKAGSVKLRGLILENINREDEPSLSKAR